LREASLGLTPLKGEWIVDCGDPQPHIRREALSEATLHGRLDLPDLQPFYRKFRIA